MTTHSLVREFESGEIDASTFSHTDHVFVVWSLIHAHGILEAIRRFEDSLRQITTAIGHPEKYNATITYALAFLTAERIEQDPTREWEQFALANTDLLEWPNRQLTAIYQNEELHTAQAKRAFVLPKRGPYA